MHEITIISGKGGTGKTSITGAFAHLAWRDNPGGHIICDLDVDAPDLHLLLDPQKNSIQDFKSGHVPRIDLEICTDCGECSERCRFDAISRTDQGPKIDPIACEGCKVCVHFCPVDAIEWNERTCGEWYTSETRFGSMVHAQLYPGQENSGLLVSLLRGRAKEMAEEKGINLVISDGSPGIGCPVISSLTGTDLAVIITEPTPSGLHDLDRVADLCAHFKIPAAVIINKWDLNKDVSERIENHCRAKNISVIGRLGYDQSFVKAMVNRQVITEYADDGVAEEINAAWRKITELADLSA